MFYMNIWYFSESLLQNVIFLNIEMNLSQIKVEYILFLDFVN